MHPSIRTVYTIKVNGQNAEPGPDMVVVEEPLELLLGTGAGNLRKRTALAVTMRTPGHDEELALGFLFTEGILAQRSDLLQLRIMSENSLLVEFNPEIYVDLNRLSRNMFANSSCGVCGKASLDAVQTNAVYFSVPGQPVVAPEVIYKMPDALRQAQEAFERTGGLHAAGLFTHLGELVVLREDVGRHNAVDKVIGSALKMGLSFPLKDHVLMVSGRAGFELVQKASMAGLPWLVAVGAPTSLSVELAESCGMTLVGFLRGQRFNVYSHPERLLFPVEKEANP
ncbi:MAG: formate dehydrogenase accessory sulfurtransferase FdhD [Saprospiraceae bacterium]|nr:formate dehydrogenase accessory sulfurtransferase FdhD [Saprospiraceae bacterium]